MQRRLRKRVLLEAALVIGASLGDVAWSIATILGRFDPAITWDYLLTSNHERATLIRVRLALLLAALINSPRTYGPVPLTAASLGVLATFSYLSHGTAIHGSSALLADLGYFIAATLWGGAVPTLPSLPLGASQRNYPS